MFLINLVLQAVNFSALNCEINASTVGKYIDAIFILKLCDLLNILIFVFAPNIVFNVVIFLYQQPPNTFKLHCTFYKSNYGSFKFIFYLTEQQILQI